MKRYEDAPGGNAEHESMGDRMKHKAEDASEEAKDRAHEAADQARAKAHEYLDAAKAHVNELVDEQKSRLASGIGSVAEAIRAASGKLREDGMEPADRWVDSVAEQVDSCRQYVEEREALDMLGEVRGFAKRNPYVLVGAAFVTGIGIARFVKASEQRHRRSGDASASGDYEAGRGTPGYYGSPGSSERQVRSTIGRAPSGPRQTPTTPPTPGTGQTPSQRLQSRPGTTEQE